MVLMRSWVDIEEERGDDEYESISHVLWDCLVYNTLRND